MAAVGGAAGLLPTLSNRSDAAGDSFRTITLSEGEQRTVHLDDGETFENVLVDQRADGAYFRINTSGNVDDFAVRNVGFLGVPQGESHVMNLAGNGVVENVFLDGRQRADGTGTKMGGIRMKRGHSGRIEIRHTFVAGMGNNASYASSAGKNGGGGGAVIYENCYHRDNTSSNYRPGTSGSRIRNSVSIVNDPQALRGPYPHSGARGSRAAWVKHYPDQRIENCAFYVSPDDCNPNETLEVRHFEKSDGSGVEVTIANTGINADAPNGFNERSEVDGYARIVEENLHENPSVDVLQDGGVPLNARMAASGGRAMPPAIDQPVPAGGMEASDESGTPAQETETATETETDTSGSTLTIDGDGADRTDYAFTVSGDLSENPSAGSLGTGDSIDGSSASGFVNGGADGYAFTGELTALSVDGNAPILVDGEEVDPESVGDGSSGEDSSTGGSSGDGSSTDDGSADDGTSGDDGSTGDSGTEQSFDKVLVVDGTGDDVQTARYTFTVTGEVQRNDSHTHVTDGGTNWDAIEDVIDGDRVIGIVGNGADAYGYSGRISDLEIRGDATFTIVRSA